MSFLRTNKTQSTNKTEQVNLNNQNLQNSDEVLFDDIPKTNNDAFRCVVSYGIPTLTDDTPTIIYKPIDLEYVALKYGYPQHDIITPNPDILRPESPIIDLKYGIPDFAPVNPEIPEEPELPVEPKPFEPIITKYGFPDMEPEEPPVKPDTPETPEEPELPVKPEPFEPIITKYGFPELEEPDQPPVEPETPETPDEPKPSEWESATLPKKLNMVRSMMNKFKAFQKDDENK